MSRPEPDPRLLKVAEDIIDDHPVDWPTLTTTLDEPALGGRLEQLRTLDSLVAVFRLSREVPAPAKQTVLFRWGTLEVHERLGAGSFGEVYRATDTVLGRQVALKLRPPDPSHGGTGGHRYIEEARRLASLRHPNVVAVHGAGEHGDRVGFWTDLIDGRNLSELISADGLMSPHEAVAVGQAVCRALAAVHGAGLVHGDVKPANVMRERGGRIVLIDFGAGTAMRDGLDGAMHVQFQGTPVALAPELLAGDAPTPASDLYAAGVLVYFLLTGDYPLRAGSVEKMREAHLEQCAVALADRRADLPGELVEIVERALASDPEERFASAGEMERALRHALITTSKPKRAASRRLLQAYWPVAAGLATLVAVLLLALPSLQRTGPDFAAANGAALQLEELHAVPLFAAAQHQPTFSPDGRMKAFVSDLSGSPQIWVRTLAGGESIQVTQGEVPATRPRWSGRDEIVYARRGLGIWAVPALGGEPRRISEIGRNPDVSADGSLVVFEHDRLLWTVEANGGTPEPIESVSRRFFEAVPASPAISPDGGQVVFFMQEAGPTGDLWIAPLAAGEPRRLTFDRVEAGDPAWMPDGRHILFHSRRGGTRNLWLVETAGGPPRALTFGVGEDASPAVTPRGDQILFVNTQHRWILTVIDPASGDLREVLERHVPIWLPQVSPDGERTVFFQADGAAHHLFTLRLDGSRLGQVTRGEAYWNIHPRWSADGQWLYYYEDRPEPGLRLLPAAGGESRLLAADWNWLTHMHAVPSPEGQRIAYLDQTPDTGVTRIRQLDDGAEITLPDPHLHGLEWSPDGHWVMGFTHAQEIRLCPADGGECRILTAGFRPRFGRGDGYIYFHRPLPERGMWQVWRIRPENGTEEALAVTGPHHPLDPTFDVTPAGEIVYTRFDAGRSQLWSGRLRPGESSPESAAPVLR